MRCWRWACWRPPNRQFFRRFRSRAFTTAAAMIACVERRLKAKGASLAGAAVAVFGAKGVVGGIVGVIAAEAGAAVTLVAHDQSAGLQILSLSELTSARRLKVAADINAVPPPGIEGVDVAADGAPIPGTSGV